MDFCKSLRKAASTILLDFIEKDIEYQQVAIIGREDILKTRGDVVHRFMKAYLAGIRYYKTQKEVTIRKIMQFLRTNDRQIAEFDYSQRARALPDDGKPTIKGMQLALDDIAKDNPKAKSLTVQQLIDSSFLQKRKFSVRPVQKDSDARRAIEIACG